MAFMEDTGNVKVIFNYLPPNFYSPNLYQLLKRSPGFIRCNVVVNRATGLGMTYGFAEYQSIYHAVEACEGFTGVRIGQKVLRVTIATPRGTEYRKGKVFVTGLPYSWSDAEVRDYFERFGTIASTRVCRDRLTGLSNGTAHVLFDLQESGGAAVAHHEAMAGSLKVFQKLDMFKPSEAEGSVSPGIVIVKELDPSWTCKKVVDYYGHLGVIDDCNVLPAMEIGGDKFPCMAVIKFQTKDTAELLVKISNAVGRQVVMVN